MTDMQLILSLGAPMYAGMAWIIKMMFTMKKEISLHQIETNKGFEEIRKDLRGLDSRLSHLEGYLIGRGQKIGE